MINEFILNEIKNTLNRDEFYNSSSLSYNSLIEEALKLVLRINDVKDDTFVIVKENTYLANNLYQRMLPFFKEDELVLYTPEESMRSEAIVASYENRAARLNALSTIVNKKAKAIITTSYGIIRHLPNKDDLERLSIKVKVGDILDKPDLIALLNMSGYENTLRTETPLSYASRGSIIDVFSVNYPNPLRIEFFDDEIDSIRFFDINTQRTIEQIKECEIVFASDVIFDNEQIEVLEAMLETYNSSTFEIDLDYIKHHIYSGHLYYYYAFFKKHQHLLDYVDHPILYISDEERNDSHLKMLRDETFEYLREMSEDEGLPLRFNVFGDYQKISDKYRRINGSPFSEIFPLIEEVDLPFAPLRSIILSINKLNHRHILLCLNDKEIKDVKEELEALEIKYHDFKGELYEGFNICEANLSEGFECKQLELVVYSSKEIFHNHKNIGKYARKYDEATKLTSYDELKRGDYVVHNQYGIGQYVGIENREVNGIHLDYLKILYRGNDELLVPLSQFALVRKYVSKEGVVPKLHKLGSKDWQKTKERVEESVNDIAERLMSLYSERNEAIGHAYSPDNEIQLEFENEFIYELTEDQSRAINEVKADMESPKPMDRLLCGDVGFGKTEVAIRAAMKAVLDKKQVIYLCPTTILSIQHHKTFVDRFRNFPVHIGLLNRYVPQSEQKAIIDGFKNGSIDIVIGTHRALSKDVLPKDLGLLIIDEEQRFGVEQKEKIKELKTSVDVLSLSATPIPRTLQMSLVGLRGLSTLDTAPRNRYPVQTYIVEKNMGLIKEIIERELSRNGQVFYLHNNVNEIYILATKIRKLLPDARVIVAHGKMTSEELEDVMLEFYEGRADVLICTTIIETGIDIANANTIIIEDAQNFGLSQLYQIKGRVGRSTRIAYAYLLVPPKKQLSEISAKRLDSIKEFTALGSGYKIAMRDLSIRGAGDMLGAKQSGFIDNVGLDLYLMMLSNAIARKKGEPVKEINPTPRPSIAIESYVPEDFTKNDYEKLSLYHRLEEIKDKASLFDYYLEIQDEFGNLPKQIEALFDKKRLELLLDLKYLDSYKVTNNRLIVCLTKDFSSRVDGLKLFEYCQNLSRDLKIRYINAKIEMSIPNRKEQRKKVLEILDHLEEMVKE